MQFDSVAFMILFPLAVFIYFVVPARFSYLWLLAVSIAFYATFAGGILPVLIATIVVTYAAALLIAKAGSAKKAVTAGFIVIAVGMLFVFKYLDLAMQLFGSGLRFNLILPLGISFFTFQSLSYVIDVYRGKTVPEKNPLKLALYICFFASIVSGPINRAGDMLPQFAEGERFSTERTKRGLQKMMWGYFLKLAIAGRLAIAVDNVYADADSFPGVAIAFAALAYLFMLYCDFEGYSQIVIGSALILGITMKENFRQPFFSTDMGMLWRRWHVSLSSWFRDYLYIPLGGNRKGIARKYVNVFIVLLVSGIWHGANITFFVWGAINGVFIIVGQILMPKRDRIFEKFKDAVAKTDRSRSVCDAIRTVLKTVGVYILSAYTFIYFANKDIKSAYIAVKGILTRFSLSQISSITTLGLGRNGLLLTLFMAAFVLVADHMAFKRSCDTPSLAKYIPTPARWAIYYAIVIAILFSTNLSGKEFIYSMM